MVSRLFVLCLSVLILLTGCKSETPAFLPITGGESISAPAQVEQARTQVLEYLLASSRLDALPQAEWHLELSRPEKQEYRFRNGDWLIVIWLPDSAAGNQRAIIRNEVEKRSWVGYVTPDGDVVDTHYAR